MFVKAQYVFRIHTGANYPLEDFFVSPYNLLYVCLMQIFFNVEIDKQ